MRFTVHLHRVIVRVALACLVMLAMLSTIAPLSAQEVGTATITGSLTDQANGLPVANAKIELYRGTQKVADTTSDISGNYTFSKLAPGSYYSEFRANGYDVSRTDDVYLLPNATANIRSVLNRSSQESNSGLREIASVRAVRNSLQTSSVITEHISTAKILNEGNLTVGQALLALPGITANDLDSSPGDDLHINIRGMKGSETGTLIDGHPIGPIGVTSGARGGYNYQLSPAWGFSETQVAYGTGGTALYGLNNIAGAVNFTTIEPTTRQNFSFSQGFGTDGRATSIITGAGTAGRVSYALAYGVQGSDAPFRRQVFTQNALLATTGTSASNQLYFGDVSPANVAANTWPVSGRFVLRAGTAKVRYALSPTSDVTFTAYNASSFDDKTGQGDNDSWTPQYAGYNFDLHKGADPGCAGVFVVTDNSGGLSCYNRAQYQNAFTGPLGGTPIAEQEQRNQDYSVRIHGTHGHNVYNATTFMDTYNLIYNRNNTGRTNNFVTVGEQLSDDIVTDHNDLGFGVYGYNQTETDGNFQANPGGFVTTNASINQSFFNLFLRDSWTPSSKLTLYGSAWLNQNSVTNSTELNPRLTAMFRPTTRDVIRFSAGKSTGVPAVGLLQGQPQYTSPGAITTPNCSANGLTSVVASTPNALLKSEKGTDLEASIGHRFGENTTIQATGYVINESNVIFSSLVPLTSVGLTPAPGDLAAFLNTIGKICGTTPTIANLGAPANINAGAGKYQGIDIVGRQRINRHLFLDYGYDILSARLFNIPIVSLQNNLNLIDGGQIDKVPIHQASAGLSWSSPGGTDFRFDGYYVGINNGLLRPAYTYGNASLTHHFKSGLQLNVGAYNVFNSQANKFGRIGEATFQPENQFGTDKTVLDQAFNGADGESFGLPLRSFYFSITEKI